MMDCGIAKWYHLKSLEFDDMEFSNI
jgi:hypothetical protein